MRTHTRLRSAHAPSRPHAPPLYALRLPRSPSSSPIQYFNHVVRRISARTGIVTRVAGTGSAGNDPPGGLARATRIQRPTHVFMDAGSNLYIAEFSAWTGSSEGYDRLRRVSPDGIMHYVAGGVGNTHRGQGLLPHFAALNGLYSVVGDTKGNLLMAEVSGWWLRTGE
jgi:hypothetical protein